MPYDVEDEKINGVLFDGFTRTVEKTFGRHIDVIVHLVDKSDPKKAACGMCSSMDLPETVNVLLRTLAKSGYMRVLASGIIKGKDGSNPGKQEAH